MGQVAAHRVFHRPLWHGLWHSLLFCPRATDRKCCDHRERRTRGRLGGCRVYGGGGRHSAGLGNGTCPHGRLPIVVAVVAPIHCDVFLGWRLLAARSVAPDLDAGFSGRGSHKFEPTAGGVQEILSLVGCFGMAGVYWRSLHFLSDGREAELLVLVRATPEAGSRWRQNGGPTGWVWSVKRNPRKLRQGRRRVKGGFARTPEGELESRFNSPIPCEGGRSGRNC